METVEKYYENQCEMTFNKYIIIRHYIDEYSPDLLQYFNKLLNEKIIQLDTVYDMNSQTFTEQIIQLKMTITIEDYTGFHKTRLAAEISKMKCDVKKRIHELFDCNIIINNDYYGILCSKTDCYDIFEELKNVKEDDYVFIDYGFDEHKVVPIYMLDSKFYYRT